MSIDNKSEIGIRWNLPELPTIQRCFELKAQALNDPSKYRPLVRVCFGIEYQVTPLSEEISLPLVPVQKVILFPLLMREFIVVSFGL
jgi:hypothetical protein